MTFMKYKTLFHSIAIAAALTLAMDGSAAAQDATGRYTPMPENLKARAEFQDNKFGIFLHWGIYSMPGQGEWYMNNAGIGRSEYEKLASGFYPSRFNAAEWVAAIKASGARYICITSRHHDGFSMWNTKWSDYNIMNTPYGEDVVRQLADECHRQGIKLHLYYSHIDWSREDYPAGKTGRGTKCLDRADWPAYYRFMNNQLTELLTNYGEIGAIWFDGWWDHAADSIPFDWELEEQYRLIHRLQPGCLIGNNHHQSPFDGEDIQIFERDVPGALFFFHAEGRTRLSLVTPRDQAATDYKRQSFLLVPEEKGWVRNQTFCKYFDGSRVTCFGRPGEKARGARSLLARFSVEALTKEFYTELFAWYEWAAEKAGVRFPNAVGDLSKTKEHLIRLITRLMFVWFVRERGLVPDELFDAKWLGENFLRDFDPEDDKDGNYYNAVLQNLFFATLNQPVAERRFADERSYQGKNASYGVNTLFRDAGTRGGKVLGSCRRMMAS